MGFVEPYHLAIDVGTSRVAAAISRLGADGRIHTSPFPLGRRGDTVATVAFIAEDGAVLFGDAAERRGVTEPERLIREFKRSIGDDVPFVVAGHTVTPERLYAETVASVVDLVADREGLPPEGIVLSHPVAWGAHRLGLVIGALADVGLGDVELITEPEAAARHYESERPLDEGQAVAVYDLGGGTFDAVILRREAGGVFRIIGEPSGIQNLGGADFDDLVMRHAIGTADVDPQHLSVDRDDSRLALAQLRRECIEAKEALSYDSDVTIPVLLASGSPSVRLTRAEFEAMIDGEVARTVDALDDAIDSAGIEAADLDCILLIGGSSRIPLVTERLSEHFDRPLAIDADPKSSIALGAALTGLIRTTDRALGVDDFVLDPAPATALVVREPADVGAAPVSPVTVHALGERLSRPRLIALVAGTFFFVAAVVFSTSEAAGLRLDTPMAAIDKAVSALVFRAPDAPTSQPVAAAAGEALPAPAADDSATSDDSSSRPKTSTSERTTQPATSKTSNESTPAVPIAALPSPSPSPTTDPSASPTTDPSPSPTTDPSPSPTTDPSPSPTTDPSPSPTTDPTSDPTTDPSTDPSPSPTDG